MALSDGLNVGGVYAEVGLDFRKLDSDLAELGRRLSRASRGASVNATTNVSGLSGGASGSFAGLATVASVIGASVQRMTSVMSSGLATVTRQLTAVAASLKVVADGTRATTRAAHDLYREESRQYHAAHATRLASRVTGGQMDVQTGRSGFARLPADVRYIAGIGFDRGIKAVSHATESPSVVGPHLAQGTSPPNGPSPPHRRAGAINVAALPAAAIGSVKLLFEVVRRTEAAMASVGHAGVLAFNLISGSVRGVTLRLERFGLMFGPLRTVMVGTFQLATFPLRLLVRHMGDLDRNTGLAAGSFHVLGRVASAPIAAAAKASNALSTNLGRAFTLVKYIGVGLLMNAGFKAMRSVGKSDETTQALGAKIGENFTAASVAVGEALMPAFREVLALILDIQNAMAGITPVFVTVASAIGGAVTQTFHLIRQMIVNWGAAKEYIGLVFLQVAENAGAAVKWIGAAFIAFLDWLGTNWRTIFTDLFSMVTTGISNLIKNFADLGKAFLKWVRDPLNQDFEFKMTPLLQGAKIESSALKLPELAMPNSYAERMGELLNQIMNSKTQTPEQLAKSLAGTEPGAGKQSSKSRAGEIIGARELHSMLQGSASAKEKDSHNIKKTADNTEKVFNVLSEIKKASGRMAGALMGE